MSSWRAGTCIHLKRCIRFRIKLPLSSLLCCLYQNHSSYVISFGECNVQRLSEKRKRNRLTTFSASYCWCSVICCCLAQPLVPWRWEELRLRYLWHLVLVGSRSIPCLVNSYALGCKQTARARLGLWALNLKHVPCKSRHQSQKKMMKCTLWPKCYYFTKDNQVSWHKKLIWLCLCNLLYLQGTELFSQVS